MRRRRAPALPFAASIATAALSFAFSGCGGGSTARSLEDAYERASTRLDEADVPEDTAEADPELGTPLDRDAVVALAVRRSPALAAMAHRARALVHAGRAEGALPTAELMFEVWNLPLSRPYEVGEANMYMVELLQRFPAAGARDARARARAAEAEAVLAEVASEERLVAQQAADAYAEYEQAFAERALQGRQRALLERMQQAVRARYSTGGTSLADAARVEVELARTTRALARLDGTIARARAALNALLRRPAEAPLGEPRLGPAETVRLSTDELLALATTHRGATLGADARARAAEARSEAARAEARVPEFMLGLSYMQDPGMRPGLGLKASMSLPWLWGPARHLAAQAEAAAEAERSGRDAADVDTDGEVADGREQLLTFEAQLAVLDRQSLPAARRAIDALAAAYASGDASLLDYVDAARAVIELELEAVELRGQLARSIAALERAVGAPLPRQPLTVEEAR